MQMTVADLIAELEQHDEEAIVRLAIQPSYPFQHDIEQIVGVTLEEGESVVYIAEAGQHYDAPYLPGEASRELGWR